jgi:hypothetical protein
MPNPESAATLSPLRDDRKSARLAEHHGELVSCASRHGSFRAASDGSDALLPIRLS